MAASSQSLNNTNLRASHFTYFYGCLHLRPMMRIFHQSERSQSSACRAKSALTDIWVSSCLLPVSLPPSLLPSSRLRVLGEPNPSRRQTSGIRSNPSCPLHFVSKLPSRAGSSLLRYIGPAYPITWVGPECGKADAPLGFLPPLGHVSS